MSRRTRSSHALVLVSLVLGLALGGCDDSTSPADASLSILLTDAAGDLEEAWVEITGIYLQGTTVGEGEKVWLLEESTGLIDLLTLSNATVDLVSEAIVPAGNYPQLRFIVGDAVIKSSDGKVYATLGAEHPDGLPADGMLECPSCSETGFKVNLPGGAVSIDDEAQVLVVDFDVSQTFGREAGFAGLWVMEPVLMASDFQVSGTIAGTVSLADGIELPLCDDHQTAISEFVPMATSGELQKSGNTDAEGDFKISFVEPGDYELSYDGTIQFDNGWTLNLQASHPATVNVASGATASADYTITDAFCSQGS